MMSTKTKTKRPQLDDIDRLLRSATPDMLRTLLKASREQARRVRAELTRRGAA
jgi:ribosomal 50S subunit-associated protein YjgA (DUF615 family)